jgi:hypothetical protein
MGRTLESWDVAPLVRGETVPLIAHGEHVTDVVPSGEPGRLHETSAVNPL